MTTTGWLALAAAVALLARPPGGVLRTGALATGGRLVAARTSSGRRRRLEQLPLPGLAGAAIVAAVAVVALTGGPFLALALGALLGTAATLTRDVRRSRSDAVRHRQVLSCVAVLVGELEAGAQAAAALGSAARAGPPGPVVHAFERAAERARRGGEAGAVLQADPDPSVQSVGLAWGLGAGSGAALADVLARVRGDLAAADEQRRTVAVALAGPRSSAALLSGLPLLGIGLGVAMGARPVPFLLESAAGRALCCAGTLLDVVGVLWMRRILRRAADP